MYPNPYAQQYWQQPYVGFGYQPQQQGWSYAPVYVGDAGPLGSVAMPADAPLDWRGVVVGAAIGLIMGVIFGRVV